MGEEAIVCTYVGVVVGEEASVYVWEWWWGTG